MAPSGTPVASDARLRSSAGEMTPPGAGTTRDIRGEEGDDVRERCTVILDDEDDDEGEEEEEEEEEVMMVFVRFFFDFPSAAVLFLLVFGGGSPFVPWWRVLV
jgi:hypothetical protein